MLVLWILPSDLSIPFFRTYIRIMAITSAIWQHAAHNTDKLSSPSCETGAIPEAHFFTKNIEELIFLKKSQENGPVGRKEKETRQRKQQE